MIYSDFHTHTSFSTDSHATPESMITAAIAKGLRHYCTTDHYDYLYPGKPGEFVFDPDTYFNEMRRLRKQYQPQINLRIGVELGLRNEPSLVEEVRSKYDALLAEYPFDFVIGSTHCMNESDPYYPEYWQQYSVDKCLTDYYEACLHNVTVYEGFQVYGHLDYILRYVPAGITVDETKYYEIIQEILRTLISRGKGLEVNTKGLTKGFPAPHPGLFALKEYLALGGEILTVGSDAHTPEHIAACYDRACALLQSLGYRYYTTFTKQIPEFHSLAK